MFTQNKEDRKRVEKALDVSGMPCGKVRLFLVSKKIGKSTSFYGKLSFRNDLAEPHPFFFKFLRG